eukprot:TRINITY_DN1980_c0_g1_i2.p1 TRINITY_DN1980_c0_g1~~TRINITY_DN1980_c0_g1_i2.p1  ORF type:complete len:473 (-),score=98.96 TRINITY_DN1980_c0_g1_i2:900-2318(-)
MVISTKLWTPLNLNLIKSCHRRLITQTRTAAFSSLASNKQTNNNFAPSKICSVSGQRYFQTTSLLHNKDYYKILGVDKGASSKDIKKSYYQLAKKYHPDTNKDKDAAKKFQEVSEAYEVLSDDDKRKQYDAFGSTGDHFGGMGGGGGGGFGGHHAGGWDFKSNIDPEELFRTIFGNQAGGGNPFAGFGGGAGAQQEFDFGPKEYHVNLTFQQAAKGVNKDMYVSIVDNCPSCKGTGAEPGTKPERCPNCNGTGMETVSTGPFMMRSTCRRCSGRGTWNKNPCQECNGVGQTNQRQKITVPVPAGIEDGQTVRMPVGRKEVFITFRVEKSDYFTRKGADVHTDANISLAQCALGGAIRVQGVYEDLNLQIPAGTSSHTKMKMTGKGLKRVSGYGYGDHYINIKIKPPKNLDEKQKALLQAYAEIESNTPGTIQGLTYALGGKKVVIEDQDGLVANLREALDEEEQPDTNKEKN